MNEPIPQQGQPPAPPPTSFAPTSDVQAAATSPSMAMDLLNNLLADQPQDQMPSVAPEAPAGMEPPTAPPPAPPQAPQPPPPVQTEIPPVAPVSATDLLNRYAPQSQTVETPIAEIPQEQNIQLPANQPENIGHAFAAARAETKQYRNLAEQFKRQLEEERAKAGQFSAKEAELANKLNEAIKRNGELEDQIGKLDLSQSREFRDTYDSPIDKVQGDIISALVSAGKTQDDAATLSAAIMNSQAPAELLSELPATTQGMIMYKLQEAANLFAKRDHALEEWRTTRSGLAEVSVRDSVMADATHRAEVVNNALDKVRQIAPTLAWDDPQYNPRRDEAIEKVKAWYQTAPEEQIAAAAIEGFMAPFAYEVINELQAQVADLQTRLAGRRNLSAPPVVPSFRPETPAPAPAPAHPQTPAQPQAWHAVDNTGDMNSQALGLIQGLLAQG